MKKAFGVIFLIIGSFLGLIVLMQLPGMLSTVISLVANDANGFSIGYAFGQIGAFITFAAVVFFLFWIGLKWVKK